MSRLRALAAAGYIRFVNNQISRATAGITNAQTLHRLLMKARNTAFGHHYNFTQILRSEDPVAAFQSTVPVHDYPGMRDDWWHRCYKGEQDVTWPGRVRYFAMSSGTADASSKHIPVTEDLLASVKRVAQLQLGNLTNFDLPSSVLGKKILLLGSSTSFTGRRNVFEGDMSGISMMHTPWWTRRLFIRPSGAITDLPEWRQRIAAIVKDAHKWDVGTVCGVPCWVILLFESLIQHYRLNNIHELWPNLDLYIHGGVSFTHYAGTFAGLTGKTVARMETYMASEGSFGFQSRPGGNIRLVQNAGIYFEFIPFNSATFDESGQLTKNTGAVTIDNVVTGIDYAVVISTCGGAWRYLIGDVVNFTDADLKEIRIVGRTRQFLDICGEHLSVENLTRAVHEAAQELGRRIGEFSVAPEENGRLFGHRWYVGCDEAVDKNLLAASIDRALCTLNDDYRVMRQSVLRHVSVEVLSNETFYGFLRARGREGGMNKFPRVMNGPVLKAWQSFIAKEGIRSPTVKR